MTKETILCDRCGKECETFKISHGHLLWKKRKIILRTSYEERVDLCQKCYDELDEWFKQK